MPERRQKAPSLWKALTIIVTVFAVIKELRTPKSKRTWHGKLIGLIPYDFRFPSWQRIKDTYWNPEGPVIAGRVWGVGWTVNVGRVKEIFTS